METVLIAMGICPWQPHFLYGWRSRAISQPANLWFAGCSGTPSPIKMNLFIGDRYDSVGGVMELFGKADSRYAVLKSEAGGLPQNEKLRGRPLLMVQSEIVY